MSGGTIVLLAGIAWLALAAWLVVSVIRAWRRPPRTPELDAIVTALERIERARQQQEDQTRRVGR